MKTMTKTRRKTLNDKLITDEMIADLGLAYLTVAEDPFNLKQVEIIEHFVFDSKFNLGNETIARIVQYLIPESKPTAGGVASQLRNIRKRRNEIDMLMNELMKGVE